MCLSINIFEKKQILFISHQPFTAYKICTVQCKSYFYSLLNLCYPYIYCLLYCYLYVSFLIEIEIVLDYGSYDEVEPKLFYANHAFVYYIINKHGVVLFAGKLLKP